MSFQSIRSCFLLCFLSILPLLPLPKYLSLHQHISNTSLPNLCLYIHYLCLLCFLLLPFLLDVAFVLCLCPIPLSSTVYLHDFYAACHSNPSVLAASFASLVYCLCFLCLSTSLYTSISPILLCRFHVFTSVIPVCFASRCLPIFLLLPLLSLPDSSLFNSICP